MVVAIKSLVDAVNIGCRSQNIGCRGRGIGPVKTHEHSVKTCVGSNADMMNAIVVISM